MKMMFITNIFFLLSAILTIFSFFFAYSSSYLAALWSPVPILLFLGMLLAHKYPNAFKIIYLTVFIFYTLFLTEIFFAHIFEHGNTGREQMFLQGSFALYVLLVILAVLESWIFKSVIMIAQIEFLIFRIVGY